MPDRETARLPRFIFAVALTLAIAGAAVGSWAIRTQLAEVRAEARSTRQELESIKTTLESVRATLELIRVELVTNAHGVDAALAQLRIYAPEINTASGAEIERVRSRLLEAMRALEGLGPEIFDDLLEAIRTESSDAVKGMVTKALLAADLSRARPIVAQIIRGTDFKPSPRFRQLAANHLVDADPSFAADVLAEFLLMSSARGVIKRRVPPRLAQEMADIALGATEMPSFHTMVTKYLACKPATDEAGRTLQMIIGREEHDQITVQTCVRELGNLEYRPALEDIQKLYHRPIGTFDSPLFRNHCLRAIGKIAKGEACSFFQQELIANPNPIVQGTLKDLVKQYCP